MERGDRAAKRPPKRGEQPRQEPAGRASSVDERLHLAETILGFGMWDWDVVTGEVTWTPELEALYGLEPGAFGRTYADFARRVHPDDLARVERCRDEAVAAGRGFDFDFRLVRPDGKLRWVHCKGQAVCDAAGRVRRIVGVNIDITADKDVREALALNEARLSTALKLSDLVIFHQDRQLRYTWVANPALVQSAQDLLGRSDDEVLGKEEARPLVTIKRRVMRTGQGERHQLWVSNNGRSGCFDLIVEPERASDGRITGVICAATDITQREQAEAFLRLQAAILENLEEGVNLVDAQGILRYTNPKFDAMFGYAAGELIGQPAAVLNAPGDAAPEETARTILDALARDGCWRGDIRNRRKDGSEFLTHAKIVAAHHPGFGKVWVSAQSDITALRAVEAARDSARRAIGRFADHVQDEIEAQRLDLSREVHDQIGATLTGIRMHLDALARSPGSGDLDRVRALVDQALASTRTLCSGLRPPMLDDLGLAETLRWYVRDWAGRSGIRASTRIAALAAEPGDPLRIDLFRMAQELLTNVARHSGARHVRVSLGQGRGGLRLRVADDGRGFPPGERAGLGLIGIRERLRRHRGDLQIESGPDGATVTLTIPAASR